MKFTSQTIHQSYFPTFIHQRKPTKTNKKNFLSKAASTRVAMRKGNVRMNEKNVLENNSSIIKKINTVSDGENFQSVNIHWSRIRRRIFESFFFITNDWTYGGFRAHTNKVNSLTSLSTFVWLITHKSEIWIRGNLLWEFVQRHKELSFWRFHVEKSFFYVWLITGICLLLFSGDLCLHGFLCCSWEKVVFESFWDEIW